jgi:hypothetical protein
MLLQIGAKTQRVQAARTTYPSWLAAFFGDNTDSLLTQTCRITISHQAVGQKLRALYQPLQGAPLIPPSPRRLAAAVAGGGRGEARLLIDQANGEHAAAPNEDGSNSTPHAQLLARATVYRLDAGKWRKQNARLLPPPRRSEDKH